MSAVNQLVSIRRPEPQLPTLFEEMYQNERLVDVTLSCCNGQLQAHKLVLAACSRYFSDLFDKLPNAFHYPVVVMKDMQIEDLKLIVDFMYRGQLTLSRDRLAILLKSAENLQVTGLSNLNAFNSISSINELEVANMRQNSQSHMQVLSQSLAANRSSLSGTTSAGSSSSGRSSGNRNGLFRGRVHTCSICWKTFREKANLKRHLSIHSTDRTLYTCPDCNKTFSWKDNYIRHTKTAHHMSNARRTTTG